MRVAVAQINPILGNFLANQDKILKFITKAKDHKCDLIVFPEAALFGYHPFDLLERKNIVKEQLKFLNQIEKKMPKGIYAVVGAITLNLAKLGKPYFNSAVVLEKGKKQKIFHKQLLPTGDVFDEARFIENGDISKNKFTIKNKNILITICEDIWAWPDKKGNSFYKENPLNKIKSKFDLVINISASPFYPGKINRRKELATLTAKKFSADVLYVNMVGAQDEIIFDGSSFAVDKKGKIIFECLKFEEDFTFFDQELKSSNSTRKTIPKISTIEELRQAIVLGIRDFCNKAGFEKIHIGLSGGIDSAVVACLAADALGPQQIMGLALPGPFSEEKSLNLAQKLAKNLKIQFTDLSIVEGYSILKSEIDSKFNLTEFSVTHENLQARLRGTLLMAFANAKNSLLLSTSNKSEFATGYSTLYGDMCGGLVPIGDLTKAQVYDLAKLYNSQYELIPQEIIDRAPSAELRPNQKDQDSLPPYDKLDKSVVNLVENCKEAISETDRWLLPVLLKTEFKRWQAAPILKVSKHSFGRGRRLPIAHQALKSK